MSTEQAAWPAAKVEMWALADIHDYPQNPRTHPKEQIDLLAKAMLDDGVTAPILVDDNGTIIYGHGRKAAALKNGFAEYPVVVARGWSDEQKRASRIRDNSIGLMSGWESDLLKLELTDLVSLDYDIESLGLPQTELAALGLNIQDQAFPELQSGDRPSFQQMTFTLHDSQVEQVKTAITMVKKNTKMEAIVNENSNGNALAYICEVYSRRPDQSGERESTRKAPPLQRKNRK